MPVPKKVRVAPYEYTVEAHHQLSELAGAAGGCISDSERIVYDPVGGPVVVREVVLHELLHAIWSQTYLKRKFPDDGTDSKGEAIIGELAPRLLSLLRDNPKLVAWLTERTA